MTRLFDISRARSAGAVMLSRSTTTDMDIVLRVKPISISWVGAYDLELLFGDLAGPCRGPSLRDEFSLDIFTSEGTHFQLE